MRDARTPRERAARGASRGTREIEPVSDSCRLVATHDQLRADANARLHGGRPVILSGLRAWRETSERLATPGSPRYT
ncbi:hypothetical protein AB0F42_07725 [Streptomyces buecherae]|uniref:hypothetical protein n=1 Tax=Streptomyces buecherae TaxID=2763006 RepID=UPI0033E658FF